MTSTPRTITEDELAAYYKRNGANSAHAAAHSAAEIFAWTAANREPEYEPGAMYQDAAGDPWQFAPAAGSPGRCWLTPGVARESAGYPLGPFRKLVPLPDRDALIAVLGATITGDLWGTVADRILALMEGGGGD